MSDDDVQHSPWPADGLPLAEAFWRVIDLQPRERKLSDQIWLVLPPINIFCDTMEKGHYRGKGRRGSPAAELTDIPATAWQYFDFLNRNQSVLYEGIGGIAWYDVRIWPIGAEQEPKPPPVEPFRTGAPGRPTAMHHIETEAKRRVKDGEVTPKTGELTKFAKELAIWWEAKRKEFDPTGPTVASRTIENRIRHYWRNLSKPRKAPP
jgi:hypothetical protein